MNFLIQKLLLEVHQLDNEYMYYVYLLQSLKNREIYVGSTNDLKRRINEHNLGKHTSTRRYLPWRLVSYEAYFSKEDARIREKKLKKHGNTMKQFKLKSKYSLFKKRDMPSTTFNEEKSSAGYVTLISVLITSAVGIAIVVSVILLGLSNSRSAFLKEQSSQARVLADACVEEALQQIRDSAPFTGTGSVSLGQGDCDYTVVSGGGQNRTITATGTVDNVVRKARVIIDGINPQLSIVSWEEVADF